MSSQEILLPASNLMLSQRQEFLDNLSVQIPVTPNPQGTFEMREEVLASARAEEMDTSGYEVSDLEDVEFFWANPQVEFDAVFRLGIHTPFSPTAFDDLDMG